MTHDAPPCAICAAEARHVGYFLRTVHPGLPRWRWWGMQVIVVVGAVNAVLGWLR